MKAIPVANLLSIALVSLTIGACATFEPPPRVEQEPTSVAPQPFATKRAPVALVLSGGAARGYAHVGIIKVLEENGLRPDLVVGSSSGSVVGALYASGNTAAEVEQIVDRIHTSLFNDVVFPGLGWLPGELGLIRGAKFQRFINDNVRQSAIQDFPIRFAAVATDFNDGSTRVFNAGDPGLAIRASSALPGVITLAEIGGHYVGDGHVTSPLPVGTARALGAGVVVAVDATYPPEQALMTSVFGVVFQSLLLATHRITEFERVGADLVIVPKLKPTSGQFTFSDRGWIIRAGEEAAREALPELRAAFARSRK